MTKLNFHREKNMFMDWIMLNDMSTGEIALWHTLMNMGNRLGQRRLFNAPASTLMRLTGLSFSESAPMEFRNLTQQLTEELTIHKEKVKEKRRGGSGEEELHSIFITYEKNINKLTPLVKRDLYQWIHALGREVVEEAIHITVKKGGRTFSYTEAILNEWESHNLKTLEEIRRYEAEKGLRNRKKLIQMPSSKPEIEEESLEEWAREVFQ